MSNLQLHDLLGNTDIYLLDQIMKGRYAPAGRILDAGAGAGRNLHWFVQNGFSVFGTDRDAAAVAALKRNYPGVPEAHFQLAPVEILPFSDAFFDHVICCAVLHFATTTAHFSQMFGELLRVLRPGGSLFVRVATDIGLADKMVSLGNGRYRMPDGTDRYLLTKPMINAVANEQRLIWLEPLKVVNVNDLRAMATLVFQK